MLPVVDRLEKFIGAVRFSTLHRAASEETEVADGPAESLTAAIVDGWLGVLAAMLSGLKPSTNGDQDDPAHERR